ncbi:hypothetical protein [Silvimonas sp.]|nr:hypothetical protein [Silvimonas sp.]MDR3428395.1 hypothetical protein [Silvimonas sp.]
MVLIPLLMAAPLAAAETTAHHHHDHHPVDKTIRKTKAWFHRHF